MHSPLTPLEREATAAYKDRLAGTLGDCLSRIILFGSRARGEGHEESDLDLAVVVRGDESKAFEAARNLSVALNLEYDYGVRISPLVLSEERLQDLHQRELAIGRAILDEGIPL